MDNNYFKKWLIWNLGGGAVVIFVTLAVLLLVGSDIFARASNIELQRKNLAARFMAIDSLIALRAGSVRAEDLLPRMQNSLPSKDQLIGFSRFLESIARTNKLNFNFSFLDEIAGSETAPSTNNFMMTLSGSYTDFLNFLKEAEASQYFIGFNSFEIVSKGPVFETVIKGKIFAQ